MTTRNNETTGSISISGISYNIRFIKINMYREYKQGGYT